MKNRISIEDICNTSNSVMQIIKNTKNFVKSEYKYRRFLKSSYQNSCNTQTLPNTSITRPHSVISRTTQSFAGMSKYEDETFSTKPEIKFNKPVTTRPKTATRSLFSADFFGPNFYEFINQDEKMIDMHIDPKYTIDQYCLRYLDKVRERKLNYESKYKTVYNKDHETDEVHLNLKSFKLTLQEECVEENEPIRTYLPFELIFLLAFLTYEDIIFTLSQSIFFNEQIKRMCFNADKIAHIIKAKFDGKKSSLTNIFKFDKNVTFKLISEKKTYIATLHCPQITFHFVNRNFTITKHIYLEFFIFLFNDCFKNWEHIVLNTFKSNKDFRFHFNKITSKSNPYKFNLNKIYLSIDKRFKSHAQTYSVQDISLPLVFKDKEVLKLVNIYGYSVELKSLKIEKYFNWRISLILLQLRNKINIDSWINRRTKIEKSGKIVLDKEWFDGLDNNIVQFICKDHEYYHERRMLFRVNEPRLVVQTIIDGKLNKDTYTFPKDELNMLCNIHKLDDFLTHVQKNLSYMNDYLVEIRSKGLVNFRKGATINTENF
jgi:hypothetical protein